MGNKYNCWLTQPRSRQASTYKSVAAFKITIILDCTFKSTTWPVPSKLLVNPPEERLPANNWPPRPPVNLPPPPEV